MIRESTLIGLFSSIKRSLLNINNIKADKIDVDDLKIKLWNDFVSSSGSSSTPWIFTALGSGTVATGNISVKHPGVLNYSSSTAANSGYRICTSNCMILNGKEKTTIIFRTSSQLMGVTRRMGFHNSLDYNPPTDGVYCRVTDGVIIGHSLNNSNQSITSTTYPLLANTWYRLKIELSADFTTAIYTLYADDSDTILWQDILTTNLPIGRYTGHGDVCTYGGSAVISIGSLDYMDVFLTNARKVS